MSIPQVRIAAQITCRLLAEQPEHPQPGDMWLCPWFFDGHISDDSGLFSPQYHQQFKALRAPFCVALPGGGEWMPDSRASSGGYWDVSGGLPRVTAMPSIQTHNWHGWLKDGVLTQA